MSYTPTKPRINTITPTVSPIHRGPVYQQLKKHNRTAVWRDTPPKATPYGLQGFAAINDHVFKYLFLKDRYRIDWDRESIPLELIWLNMKKYALPVYSEYIEKSDNYDFLKVKDRFFFNLFWAGTIYVGYNVVYDENQQQDENTPENGFSLFVKVLKDLLPYLGINETKGKPINPNNLFLSLDDGVVYELEDWKALLIPVSWPHGEDNFINWFLNVYNFQNHDKAINNMLNLTVKKLLIKSETVEGLTNTGVLSKITQLLNSPNPYLFSLTDINNGIKSEYIDPSKAVDFQLFTLTTYLIRDRSLYELGRVANLNPKKERKTTWEDYKDISGIASRQRATLDKLKLFALDVLDRWGISLDFSLLSLDLDQKPDPSIDPNENPENDGAEGY